MSDGAKTIDELSFRRIVGFACNQSFVFFLFYMGENQAVAFGGLAMGRVDLLVMLCFMVCAFLLLGRAGAGLRSALLSRPSLIVYALVLAVCSLFPLAGLPNAALGLVAYGLAGACVAALLVAWGRCFSAVPTKTAVCEVFLGSLGAAALCLVFSLATSQEIMLLMRVFPVAGAAWIELPASAPSAGSAALFGDMDEAASMSGKVLCGTLCFGLAAGFLESFGTQPGLPAYPSYQVAMLLFAALLIGSLSLLLSDAFGRGDALNKSYRLSVFVMVMGVLCIPLFSNSDAFTGESAMLAGYLGLEAVLIALFQVVAKITGTDGVAAFSRGFMCLFAGELLGLLASNLIATSLAGDLLLSVTSAIAGGLTLVSYIFLFTERDFDSLSKIAIDTDSFTESCRRIGEDFGLSKREREILPYALKGRTGSRIAESLGVSKSTVDTHLRRIYAKTGVHSRQELIDLGESIRKDA